MILRDEQSTEENGPASWTVRSSRGCSSGSLTAWKVNIHQDRNDPNSVLFPHLQLATPIDNYNRKPFYVHTATAMAPLLLLNDIPLTKPPSAQEEGRRHLQQTQLDHVCILEERLMGMDRAVLSEEDLTHLFVRRLAPLDVDENAVDAGPLYFRPRFSRDELDQTLDDEISKDKSKPWRTKCDVRDHPEPVYPDGMPLLCSAEPEAAHNLD